MFQNIEKEINASTWHILQLVETEQKGIFKVWLYLENKKIISINLEIMRTIYINSKLEMKNLDENFFKLVKRILPRGDFTITINFIV